MPHPRKFTTLDFSSLQAFGSEAAEQTNQSVRSQLKDKCQIFSRWNARREHIKNRTTNVKQSHHKTDSKHFKTLIRFAQEMKTQQTRQQSRSRSLAMRKKSSHRVNSAWQGQEEELKDVIENRRERFKKVDNPLSIVHHYINRKVFTPSAEQSNIVEKMVELKALISAFDSLNNASLQKILNEIYMLMNMAVDYNELRLLIILILLAAEVCRQAKDFNRAFYFCYQAKLGAELSNLVKQKIEALIAMSRITEQLGELNNTITFLKKALGYAWLVHDSESEMLIYDLIGQAHYKDGQVAQAKYYHSRYAQNQLEHPKSSIRHIYAQIMTEYRNNRDYSLYDGNINLLLLETLSLPIDNVSRIPASISKQVFSNYREGMTPRKDKMERTFRKQQFPDVLEQIGKVLSEDLQFEKQMPDPNIQPIFTPSRQYSRIARQMDFERSPQYQTIRKQRSSTPHRYISGHDRMPLKFSLQKQIERASHELPNDHMFDSTELELKQTRMQKIGKLRGRIYKTHLKSKEQHRVSSAQCEQMKMALNKALLDWINPLK